MARQIKYEDAAALLGAIFTDAEADFAAGAPPAVPDALAAAMERLLSSNTQAYREVLIGCGLARLLDDQIDVRLPYVNQGDAAYNGRTLDEQVVNPFFARTRSAELQGALSVCVSSQRRLRTGNAGGSARQARL